jgi:hypothetical protein
MTQNNSTYKLNNIIKHKHGHNIDVDNWIFFLEKTFVTVGTHFKGCIFIGCNTCIQFTSSNI